MSGVGVIVTGGSVVRKRTALFLAPLKKL